MLLVRLSEGEELFGLIEQGRLEDAVGACERALTARADDVVALHAFGVAQIKRGHIDDALALLERAVAIDGTSPALQNNCGEAHRLLGDLEAAFTRYRRAMELDKDNPVVHVNMGLVMRAQGKIREAEHFFKNAVQLRPHMPRPYLELAELYREEGDSFKAAQCYRQALSLAPQAAWQNWAAVALAEIGDIEVALGVLKRAAAADSGNEDTWRHLARSQFELCHEREAVASYRRALEMSPAAGRHGPRRVVVARRERPHVYCGRGLGEYRRQAQAQWLRLAPPRAIPPEAASAWLAAGLHEPHAPEIFVLELHDSEVLPEDFVVLAGASLLVDGLVNRAQQYGFHGRCVIHEADDHRVLLDLPGGIEELEEPCAVLGGNGDLFAFLFEGVARLWGLEQRPGTADLPVIVPDPMARERRELLERLGVGEARLRLLAADRSYRCRTLHVPSLPLIGDSISPVAIQFLRRRLSATLAEGAWKNRRLYFSRASCATRRVRNEAELTPMLASHGFEVIEQRRVGLAEQLALFREADAVIAMDDENLASLVVAPLGARVGAIAIRGIYRPRAYFVAAQLGHGLTYLQAEPDFDSHPIHAECDVTLSPGALREFLSAL